ncbi:MAG: hypothetical protein B7X41_20925 [Microbacterium sp. 14-71-5]|nr:MAG: hypothetical protein B7X41_20925 [Microbacterium sp. 14-71-5]
MRAATAAIAMVTATALARPRAETLRATPLDADATGVAGGRAVSPVKASSAALAVAPPDVASHAV